MKTKKGKAPGSTLSVVLGPLKVGRSPRLVEDSHHFLKGFGSRLVDPSIGESHTQLHESICGSWGLNFELRIRMFVALGVLMFLSLLVAFRLMFLLQFLRLLVKSPHLLVSLIYMFISSLLHSCYL